MEVTRGGRNRSNQLDGQGEGAESLERGQGDEPITRHPDGKTLQRLYAS